MSPSAIPLRFLEAPRLPEGSTTSKSPPRVVTSSVGFLLSPNDEETTRNAHGASFTPSAHSKRNTSDARVATHPIVSRAATAITSLAYVPHTKTVTEPDFTSDAVIASSFAFAMNSVAVRRSGRVKHEGSTVSLTIDTGNRCVVRFLATAMGARSITHCRNGKDTAARPCGAIAAHPIPPSVSCGRHSATTAPSTQTRARLGVICINGFWCVLGPTQKTPHPVVHSSPTNPRLFPLSWNELDVWLVSRVRVFSPRVTWKTRVALAKQSTSVVSSGAHI